jgi:hypothetical protein
MRCRSVLALLCGMSVLAIAGCTENPAASHPSQTPPSSTSSPTQAQTPEPQPPEMPAAAKAKTEAGLEAFARHWMGVKNYMSQTGQTEGFLALNQPSCEWCRKLAASYQEVYAAGGYYSGQLASAIRQFQLTRFVGAADADIQFRADVPASVRVSAKGAAHESLRSAVRDYTLNVTFVSGEWKIQSATWKTVGAGS